MIPAFIGIDWGTTHRRTALISTQGELLAERVDAQGALACAGRFRESLDELLAMWPQAGVQVPIVMAGMVGSALGWQHVSYLEAGTPLLALARHLQVVRDAPAGRRCYIVPGYCLRNTATALAEPENGVDVMRGEETQLFGALAMLGAAAADGYYVLPGTHSKWVRVQHGCVLELRTYMTGELFGLLREHGTLAAAMQAAPSHIDIHSPAFASGVHASRERALSHALFGARARIVTGAMAVTDAAAYISGLLIGAEWTDAQRITSKLEPVRLIGDRQLTALHQTCASLLDRRVEILDAHDVQLAAWRSFAQEEALK